MALATSILIAGTRGAQPAASAANNGCYYRVTDEGNIVEQSTGATWEGIGATVDVSTGATGVLPVANGGTGSASGAPILRDVTDLTNAQIIALPTTPITLLAAPGSGLAYVCIGGAVYSKTAAGAYTGINAAATLNIQYGTNLGPFANWIVNDSTITNGSTTVLTNLLGTTTNKFGQLTPYMETEGVAAWGPMPLLIASAAGVNNQPIKIDIDNAGGAGTLGGGNAANVLRVVLYYTIESLP